MNIVAYACASVVLHELAHVGAARALGVHIYQIGMSWKGPFIRREPGSHLQNLCISLAGPAFNLLLGILFFRVSHLFAVNNLVLAVCNLVPFPQSDGSRALSLLKLFRGGEMPKAPSPQVIRTVTAAESTRKIA